MMVKRILFALMLIPTLASAQYDSVKRADAIRFADGVIHTYASPLRWKSKNWVEFGAVLGGTVGLTLLDQPVRRFWSHQHSETLDGINNIGYHYGKPYAGFAITAGLYSAGLFIKNQWARETALMLGTSLITSGLLEMGLKPLIGRARPQQEQGNYDLTILNKEAGFHSFPSGHASMAYTISFVLARQVRSVPLKIAFYSFAGATTICRLYSDAHWLSDVAFGGVLGWYCSEAVIKRLKKNHHRNPSKNTIWNISPHATGLTLRATFN
jgi:membrane-associated phospholipid phosphatase